MRRTFSIPEGIRSILLVAFVVAPCGILAGVTTDWYPPQIWEERNGVAIIEVEDVEHFPDWNFITTPQGFTGRGHLKYIGSRAPGSGNDDYTGDRQMTYKQWIILRVYITTPDTYYTTIRGYHEQQDGDNDCWFNRVGREPTQDAPIKRMGIHTAPVKTFAFQTFGDKKWYLSKGVNDFYIGGRSPGFCVDRAVFYRLDQKQIGYDITTPPSALYTPVAATGELRVDFTPDRQRRMVLPLVNGFREGAPGLPGILVSGRAVAPGQPTGAQMIIPRPESDAGPGRSLAK